MKFRDVKELISTHSEANAKIKGRICPETGEKIPDGMPMWRWRRRRRSRKYAKVKEN